MKVTVVPAQVTTIEDRVAGNLGLSQLLLLSTPIFIGSLLYVILPPGLHSATYKLVVIAGLALICSLLAIRLKGQIVLLWLAVLLRYWLRPRYYVADKNSSVLRAPDHRPTAVAELVAPVALGDYQPAIELSDQQLAAAAAVMEDPTAQLAFMPSKKGGLHVFIREV